MPRRVLVVDDHRDAADSLAALLRVMGHDSSVAYDGAQAMLLAESLLPEFVLLDLALPIVEGWAVARHIRSQEWGQDMILIASTGLVRLGDDVASKEAGFDHYMVKPLDLALLAKLLALPPE